MSDEKRPGTISVNGRVIGRVTEWKPAPPGVFVGVDLASLVPVEFVPGAVSSSTRRIEVRRMDGPLIDAARIYQEHVAAHGVPIVCPFKHAGIDVLYGVEPTPIERLPAKCACGAPLTYADEVLFVSQPQYETAPDGVTKT